MAAKAAQQDRGKSAKAGPPATGVGVSSQPKTQKPTGTMEEHNQLGTSDFVPDFSWVEIAKAELGQRELPGLKHNPRILEYHATTSLKGTTDEIPWCSSFVNWCMTKAGYTGTRSAAARTWAQWGQRLAGPVPGCIVVLTRDGGGHVGFYVSQDAKGVRILGGNQSDKVSIATYDRKRVIAYVVPKNLKPNDNEILYRRLAEFI